MGGERLVVLLTEIRDQQKQQIQNFENAIQAHADYVELQRKSRRMFQFMVFAPWVALAAFLAWSLLPR